MFVLSYFFSEDYGGHACISLGTCGWSEGVHEFSIKLSSDGGAHTGVGVSLAGINQTDLKANLKLFYALDCGNGKGLYFER